MIAVLIVLISWLVVVPACVLVCSLMAAERSDQRRRAGRAVRVRYPVRRLTLE